MEQPSTHPVHTQTLVGFLRARLRADWAYALGKTDLSEQDPIYEYAKIAARRTIRSVEAQRRIIDRLTALAAAEPEDVYGDASVALADTLRLLALPYADHPDYRDDWRP